MAFEHETHNSFEYKLIWVNFFLRCRLFVWLIFEEVKILNCRIGWFIGSLHDHSFFQNLFNSCMVRLVSNSSFTHFSKQTFNWKLIRIKLNFTISGHELSSHRRHKTIFKELGACELRKCIQRPLLRIDSLSILYMDEKLCNALNNASTSIKYILCISLVIIFYVFFPDLFTFSSLCLWVCVCFFLYVQQLEIGAHKIWDQCEWMKSERSSAKPNRFHSDTTKYDSFAIYNNYYDDDCCLYSWWTNERTKVKKRQTISKTIDLLRFASKCIIQIVF